MSMRGIGNVDIDWRRKEQLKRYLVGNAISSDKSLYHIISLYEDMEKNGVIGRGPIEVQYSRYINAVRSGNNADTLKRGH